uniref:Uncharacterized protein n=1 Tax=Romanomermis culicivorax TaxID=13658 RepID=A0A915JXR8_ROMCU
MSSVQDTYLTTESSFGGKKASFSATGVAKGRDSRLRGVRNVIRRAFCHKCSTLARGTKQDEKIGNKKLLKLKDGMDKQSFLSHSVVQKKDDNANSRSEKLIN